MSQDIDWMQYRTGSDGHYDLLALFDEVYKEQIPHCKAADVLAARDFLISLESIRPLISRQATAVALATARRIMNGH